MLVEDCERQEDEDVRLEHARGRQNFLERLAAVRGAERLLHLRTGIDVELVKSLGLHKLQSYAEGDFRPFSQVKHQSPFTLL